MDLLFQTPTVEKGKRMNPLFTFRSYSMPLAGEFQYSGLCYIGKDASHIARLRSIYNKVYIADRVEHVRNELLLRIGEERSDMPEIIICEASADLDSLKKFSHFLRLQPALSR